MHNSQNTNDLFVLTMGQLHQEAPPGLVESLKTSLEQIRRKNPNSAQTAKSCLDGLAASERGGPCTLLKVLTAAYLINGGVMLKYQDTLDSEENTSTTTSETTTILPRKYNIQEDLDLKLLEEELEGFELEDTPCLSVEFSSLARGSRGDPPSQIDHSWSLHQTPPSLTLPLASQDSLEVSPGLISGGTEP